MKKIILLAGLLGLMNVAWGQKPMQIKIKNGTVCYATDKPHIQNIPPPEAYLNWKKGLSNARTNNATFEITYIGFEGAPAAKAAFDRAIQIWSSLISSPMPIRITVQWTALGTNVLGSASYTNAYANFEGAQKLNVYYPVAIAERITGREMNNGEPDIFARFSSNTSWNFDPDATPSASQIDLVSVVLHEIGHGLGFSGTMTVDGTAGAWGLGSAEFPVIYDVPIENGANVNIIEGFTSPSSGLRTQLVSNNLFFDAPLSGTPKLYAPVTFSQGSSISHLDENTYNGTNNSLMTPQIAPGERMHDPGLALNMLNDLGWQTIVIQHTALPNTENTTGPYTVTAKIKADNGYNNTSVKLNYSTNDGGTFTTVTMDPTGNANEFTANIPFVANGFYSYFIEVKSTNNTLYTTPGKLVRENNTQLQAIYRFQVGPDTEKPLIAHTPKAFLLTTDTQLKIEARVTDNIEVASATVEYAINGNIQTPQAMTLQNPGEDSLYAVTLNLGALQEDDVITYVIRARDNAQAGFNERLSPATGTYEVKVVGLKPTQDFYSNNFETPTDDFFGTGFSVKTETNFTGKAIHSIHPYEEGDAFPGDSIVYTYQLKVPIRVKKSDAFLIYDEVALVEPGADGSVFGNSEFFDYVIVQGSLDGGATWKNIGKGYDCRDNAAWLTRYNSAVNPTTGNSTAVGEQSLFKTRQINLLSTFNEGDEVVLRFKLYSDQLASGWGWAIDNLKIQIDETAPVVLHDHADYLQNGATSLELVTKASDASGIKSLKIEVKVNGGAPDETVFDVDPPQDTYTLNLGLDGFETGDYIEYRITAVDSADNTGTFPPDGTFIKVPFVQFLTAVNTYTNNFNAATTDFVGNFFSVSQPANFTNGAIHSSHFYPAGIGLDNTADFTYTLLKPITIANTNSYIRFDEIALVEGHTVGAVFGTAAFKDYVVVEGSKDNGTSWHPFLDGYDVVGTANWVTAFNAGSNGTPTLFKTRAFDMTASGDFQAGDNVLIRFRLYSNATINGWGWAIDNLYIQDPITGTENPLNTSVQVYPNPTRNTFYIESDQLTGTQVGVQVINPRGQVIRTSSFMAGPGVNEEVNLQNQPAGLYLVKITNGIHTTVRKIMKVD